MLNEYLGDEIDILPWSKKGPNRITSGKVRNRIQEKIFQVKTEKMQGNWKYLTASLLNF